MKLQLALLLCLVAGAWTQDPPPVPAADEAAVEIPGDSPGSGAEDAVVDEKPQSDAEAPAAADESLDCGAAEETLKECKAAAMAQGHGEEEADPQAATAAQELKDAQAACLTDNGCDAVEAEPVGAAAEAEEEEGELTEEAAAKGNCVDEVIEASVLPALRSCTGRDSFGKSLDRSLRALGASNKKAKKNKKNRRRNRKRGNKSDIALQKIKQLSKRPKLKKMQNKKRMEKERDGIIDGIINSFRN